MNMEKNITGTMYRERLPVVTMLVLTLGGAIEALALQPQQPGGRREAVTVDEQEQEQEQKKEQDVRRRRFRDNERLGQHNRPGRRWSRRGLWDRMNEEEHEEMYAFIDEYFPDMAEELKRLQERGPDRFERRMNRVAQEMREMMELMHTNLEQARLMIQERSLDMRMGQLARKYRSAEDDEQKQTPLREEMRELCSEAFEVRQQRREFQVHELEARIQELHEHHRQEEENRENLIDQEVEERLEGPWFRHHREKRTREGRSGEDRPRERRIRIERFREEERRPR